jgi:hypothetical protein
MVATSCEAIQELLTEHLGETDRFSEQERRHVEVCPQCCEAAAAERALSTIFARALPPADPSAEAEIRAALRPMRIKRRVVALLPVAASLFIALLGAVMVGGLPGGSLLALLPMWSSQGWLSLAASVGDWGTVLTTAAGAATTLLGPAALATAILVTVIGVGLIGVAARRWRRISPWHGRG